MNSLPTEVLILIFTYLHREQKLQCMLVCHRWTHILNSGIALETVSISSSPSTTLFNRQYKVLMREVQNNKSIGRKCKRLVLDHHSRIGFDKVALADLFPNLTFLALLLIETKSISSASRYTQAQSDKLKNWRNSLETLIERSYTNRLIDFLETGIFRRLTTLSLTPSSSTVRDNHLSELIEALKNTPVLNHLQFNYHQIDIFDLNELHKNVQTLVSLVMNNCTLTSSRGMIRNTQSSNSIETLKIRDIAYVINLTPEIVEFLISTYTNLKSLSLILSKYDCTNYRVTDTQLAPLVTELVTRIGSKLTEFDFRLPVKTPQVYTFLGKRQNISQLNKLEINILLTKRILYSIVSLASNCNLNTLSLTQVPPLDFGIFKKLTGLKVLRLAFKRKMINWILVNLNDLAINLTESLETLELSFIKIIIIDNHATTKPPHNSRSNSSLSIKCLKLEYTDISENASNFLSSCFHKLSSLILYYCRIGGDMDFSGHHLTFVHLVYFEKHYCTGYMEVEELDKNKLMFTHLKLSLVDNSTTAATTEEKSMYYMYRKPLYNGINPRFNSDYCNVHDHSLRSISRPTPYDESLKYFHFKCASVQSFYYNGYLLL